MEEDNSMRTDGARRKKGKYIKKNNPVYDKISVERYNFAEIRKLTVIFPDNPNNNIIHTRFHDDKEISGGLRKDTRVADNLLAQNHRAPIIFPRDFTQDWAEEMQKASKRGSHKGIDEDEFEMAMAEEKEKERIARAAAAARQIRSGENKKDEAAELQEKKGSDSGSIPKPPSSSALEELQSPQFPDLQEADSLTIPVESIEQAGQELQRLTPDSLPVSAELVGQDAGKKEAADATQPCPPAQDPPPSPAKDGLPQPEKLLAEHAAEDLTELRTQAWDEGYQQGLKEASEKIEASLQDEFNSRFAALNQGIGQLATLRQEILRHAQDNFLEIAGALSEAIFEKVLKTDPTAIKSIVEKAIVEGMDQDNLSIRLPPDLCKNLRQSGFDEHHMKIMEDPTLRADEMMIESGETTVRNNLKDMISQMLSGIDLSLYESEDSQGEDDP